MNTKDKGIIVEAKFLFEASKRGYTVSSPYGDNASYDFILDKNENLLRIQCKTLRKEKGSDSIFTADTHRKIGHRRCKKETYRDTIDYFFLYNLEEDIFIFYSSINCPLVIRFRKRGTSKIKVSTSRYIEDYMNKFI